MLSNLQMKRYKNPATGDIYWIRQEDEPQQGWIEEPQPTEIPLPDPNYVPPYTARRINAYPQIAEQLDMLWHAIDDGNLDKSSQFYTTLLEVKTSIPKD